MFTWECHHFDAPGQTPEPSHQQEGNREELWHPHPDVNTERYH